MANQSLLTVFIALIALAVLIQTGIVVGIYMVSRRLTDQAERVMSLARGYVEPVDRITKSLQSSSARITEVAAATRTTLRDSESKLDRLLYRFRQRLA